MNMQLDYGQCLLSNKILLKRGGVPSQFKIIKYKIVNKILTFAVDRHSSIVPVNLQSSQF